MTPTRTPAAPPSLVARYNPADLEVFTAEERRRFGEDLEEVAWELLYRKEPDLYERLVAGERIHPQVLAHLPPGRRCVEVGAGGGRLTAYLVKRYEEVVCVEPARPLRERLARRFPAVEVLDGFFDDLPLGDGAVDVVVSCSAFTPHPGHGGDAGLAEMARVGDVVVLVWPADVEWLLRRGFRYLSFPGPMDIEFPSLDDAVEIASIFYPHAVDEIRRRGSAKVPYDVVGMNPPRDLAYLWVR